MTDENYTSQLAGSKRIPCVFLTYDPCLIEAVHTINAYNGVTGVEFLIPYNQDAAKAFFERKLKPGIAYRLIQTSEAIIPTLNALLNACGEHEWIFWATADRYPYMRKGLPAVNRIAEALLTDQPCLKGIESIRLTHWRDPQAKQGDAFPFAGVDFLIGPPGRRGHWHHQFVRRARLERAVALTPADGGLLVFHKQLQSAFRQDDRERADVSYLAPEKPLLSYEEPTLNGRYTTNFFMRKLHDGQLLDTGRLAHESSSFASEKHAKARNAGWPKDRDALIKSLCEPPPPTRFQIVSPGGVGSKMICRWLEPDGDARLWSKMHSHRRLPPLPAFEDQRFLYVAGDPRNTVLSLFNRRHGRTELHGFAPQPGRGGQPKDEFVKLHARNMQTDAYLIDPSWDLKAYLDNGADLLRLEEHFDFWFYGNQRYPVVFLRYETLADCWQDLAGELGAAVSAPDIKQRGSDWRLLPADLRRQLNAMYGPFAKRLSQLPAITVRGKWRPAKRPRNLDETLSKLSGT